MSRRKAVYRICKKCMRVWNVSCLDPPERSKYVCPDCEEKRKEGDEN